MAAIVFDWDGTLVDTLPAILRANIEVLREYRVPFDEARYRAAYTPDWRLMYRRLGVPEAAIEAAGTRWLELFRVTETVLAPFPGVGVALGRLAAAGHRMGLVTAGHRWVVEEQLHAFELAELLPVRICGDDPVAPKPDPEPLRKALAELVPGGDPRAAIYVGDAPDDMRMARTTGARGIGIIGTLGDADDLAAAGAGEVWPSVVAWVATYLPADAAAATPAPVAGSRR
jgi:phosphoglycolate phosphatase-like HAD superfamily hydrolase